MWSRVRAWSYRFETKNKLNAFLAFIFEQLGFKALNRLDHAKNDTFIDFTCIKTHEKNGRGRLGCFPMD